MTNPSKAIAAVLLAVLLACTSSQERQVAEIRALHEQGEYAASIQMLEALLDQDPDHPELNQLYGVALLATRQAAPAVWPLSKAAEAPERALEAGILLARAHLENQSPADAIAAADRVLEQAPDLLEALLVRIDAKLVAKRAEEALVDIDTILQRDPTEPAALIAQLMALLELERVEEAEAALAAARERLDELEGQEPVQAKFCAANAIFTREKGGEGAGEKAAAEWDACLERFPLEPIVVDGAAAFFDGRGERERATEIVRHAQGQVPDYFPFRSALTQRLAAMGQSDEAERLLLDATEHQNPLPAWLALADYYESRQELSKARTAMEQVLELQPNPPSLHRFQYADMLIREEDFAAAEEAIAAIDQPSQTALLRGRLLLEQGEARRALEELEEGIRLWPDNTVARQLAGNAAEALGDFDRALSEYKEAVRVEITNWEALTRFAVLHDAQGSFEEVLPFLRIFLGKQPGDPRGYLLQIELAKRNELEKLAGDTARRLMRVPGYAGVGLAELAATRALGDPAAAVGMIEESSLDLTQPPGAPALAVLLENLGRLGRHEEALRRADAAVAVQPDFAAFHELRAAALRAAGKPATQTREALERALELEPERFLALVALAELAADGGAADEALALYDRAAAANPNDPGAAWAAIELLVSSARDTEVEGRLEALLDVHGYHAGAASLLARRLVERGENLELANAMARRAVRFQGGSEALATLGWVQLERGEAQGAVATLRRALEEGSDSPSTRYRLGRALALAGDTEAARQELRKALEIGGFPDEEQARAELARLEATPAGATR
jgi:tetratricopeptide (TPR) repeat protein